ncbi:MAG: glycosyltransferase [Bacteroidota bacterium]
MKILFVIGSLVIGGKERQCIELIKGLSQKGYECELIILKNLILYPEIHTTKCKLYVLDKELSKLKVWINIFKIINKTRPDIIQSWDTESSMYIFPFTFLLRTPFVNYCIRYGKKVKKTSKYGIISGITFFFSDFVIANSIAGLEAHSLKASPKNKYIYNGYDLNRSIVNQSVEQIKSEMKLDGQYVVGMIGNFLDAKDHGTIIEAAQIIMSKRKDVSFVFMGDGHKKDEMKKLIQIDNLDRFIFLGKITKVEEFINVFDIQCLICNTNGHAEGLSNAIMEGMAMGKPIIATDSGGNKEIVQDGVTGYIIEPFNVKVLVEKLEFLLENKTLRVSFGDKGRYRMQTHFSLETFVNNFVKLYEKAI